MDLRSEQIKSLQLEALTARLFFELVLIALIAIIFSKNYPQLTTITLILAVMAAALLLKIIITMINLRIENAFVQIRLDLWRDTLTNRIAITNATNVLHSHKKFSVNFEAAAIEASNDIKSYMEDQKLLEQLGASSLASAISLIQIFSTPFFLTLRVAIGYATAQYLVPILKIMH